MSDHFNYCNTVVNVPDEISTSDLYYTNESDDCESVNIEEKSGDDLLIELYRERPFLYDKSNIGFKDSVMKQNAWTEISDIMTKINCGDMYTPSNGQKRCTNLREQYSKEKKKIESESKSGSASAPKACRFPFFSQLKFLDHVIKRRRSYTNCTKSQSSMIGESSSAESQNVEDQSSNEENGGTNLHKADNIKDFNKENKAPKMKKRKVNETKELEQTLIQMSHRISTYMENKVSTVDDTFMEFIKAQFNSIPEKEKNMRRKMIMDVLIAPLPENLNY